MLLDNLFKFFEIQLKRVDVRFYDYYILFVNITIVIREIYFIVRFIRDILIINVYEKTLTFSCSWRRYACNINCFRSSSDINGSLAGFPDPLFCSFTITLVFSLLPTKSFIFFPGNNSFPENHSWASCTSITCNKRVSF